MLAIPCCTETDLIGNPRLAQEEDRDTLESLSEARGSPSQGLDDQKWYFTSRERQL